MPFQKTFSDPNAYDSEAVYDDDRFGYDLGVNPRGYDWATYDESIYDDEERKGYDQVTYANEATYDNAGYDQGSFYDEATYDEDFAYDAAVGYDLIPAQDPLIPLTGHYDDSIATVSYRYQNSTASRATLSHRYQINRITQTSRSYRYSNTTSFVSRRHRYNVCKTSKVVRRHRYRVYPELVAIQDPPIGGITPAPVLVPRYAYAIAKGGQSNPQGEDNDENFALTGCLFSPEGGTPEFLDPLAFSITLNESQATTWQLPVSSPRGRHSPINQTSGWSNVMALRKGLTVNLVYAGMPFNFNGYGTGWSNSRNWATGIADFVWTGLDKSYRLFVDAQTMDDVRLEMASVVVKRILDRYGVEYDLHQLLQDDYLIPVMHMQNGRPIDWIQDILEIPLLEWKMRFGRVFTPYLPNPEAAPTWRYGPDTCVEQLDEEVALGPVINQVKVVRAVETDGVVPGEVAFKPDSESGYGETQNQEVNPDAPGTECNEFGEYTVTFNPPLNAVSWREICAEGGIFSDFLFKRRGQIVGIRQPRGASTIPQSSFGFGGLQIPGAGMTQHYGDTSLLSNGALNDIDEVTFVWGEAPGVGDATGGYGRIEFTGSRGIPSVTPGGPGNNGGNESEGLIYDEDFDVTVDNFESQGLYGVWPIELSANPLFPDKATMIKHGTRYLIRTSRQHRNSTFTVPLNLLMEQGDIVEFNDVQMGLIRKILVTSCTHSTHSQVSQRRTTFQGVEYVN